MRVSTASEAQARPMAIAHGSDATGSKSVKPPSGGVVASTFQPPPCGVDARSPGGIGVLPSVSRAITSLLLSPIAVCGTHSPRKAGTSALTTMTTTTTSTTAMMMRFAARLRGGVLDDDRRGAKAGNAAAASWARPQN